MEPTDTLALVYGAVEEKPGGGLWLVHQHLATGELLGPSVSLGVPTRIVRARLTRDGWAEVKS